MDDEKMNRSTLYPYTRYIAGLLVILVLVSCSFLSNLVPGSSPSTSSNPTGSETPGVVGQPSSGGTEPTG
jgi:hypothetical protein